MNTRFISTAVLAVALVSFGHLPLAVAADPPTAGQRSARYQKVVLQVSDDNPGTWNQALNVAKNVQQEYGANNVDIEIVAFGRGIGILKMDSPVANRIDEALASHINVVACENTMRGQKLTPKDMLPKIGYVPAGAIEIIKRQQEGWGYIRP
jgi:hypothetical protein